MLVDDRGRAEGVRMADGRIIRSPIVLSNATPKVMPSLPSRFQRRHPPIS